MMALRVCYPNVDCAFPFTKCSMGSAFKPVSSLLGDNILPVISKFPNISMFGMKPDKTEGELDASLLSIQRGECDLSLVFYTSPTLAENLTQGPVFFDDIIQIMSTYRLNDGSKKENVMRTFLSFSFEVVIVYILLVIILYFALKTSHTILVKYGRMQVLSKNSSLFYTKINLKAFEKASRKPVKTAFIPIVIFMALVKAGYAFPSLRSRSLKTLWFCLIIFSSSITYFYTSMIKTDAVTVKTPKVIQSYRDILNSDKIEVMIPALTDTPRAFNFSGPKTERKKIWNEKVKTIITSSLYSVPDLQKKLLSSKAVLIELRGYLRMIRHVSYSNIQTTDKLMRVMLTSDESEKPMLRSLIMNSMIDKSHRKLIDRRGALLLESGIGERNNNEISILFMQIYNEFADIKQSGGYGDIDNYVSERILLPDPGILHPDIFYFAHLFVIMATLFLLASFILLTEIIARHSVSRNI